VEGDIHETELTVDRAYAMRAQLVQTQSSLNDAEDALIAHLATGQIDSSNSTIPRAPKSRSR